MSGVMLQKTALTEVAQSKTVCVQGWGFSAQQTEIYSATTTSEAEWIKATEQLDFAQGRFALDV
jgi:hypothetical protein